MLLPSSDHICCCLMSRTRACWYTKVSWLYKKSGSKVRALTWAQQAPVHIQHLSNQRDLSFAADCRVRKHRCFTARMQTVLQIQTQWNIYVQPEMDWQIKEIFPRYIFKMPHSVSKNVSLISQELTIGLVFTLRNIREKKEVLDLGTRTFHVDKAYIKWSRVQASTTEQKFN